MTSAHFPETSFVDGLIGDDRYILHAVLERLFGKSVGPGLSQ